jgi:quercetin dioxygenase-like cupin family protein
MKNKIVHILPEIRKGYDFLYVVFYPSRDLPSHAHRNSDELIYVVKGDLSATIGKDSDNNSNRTFTKVVSAGESIYIKRNVYHSFSCEKKVELICIEKPPVFISPDRLLVFLAKLLNNFKCRSAKKFIED